MSKNLDILAVNNETFDIYDFLEDGEKEMDLIKRAVNSKQKNMLTWKSHMEKYPDWDQAKAYFEKAKKEYLAGFTVMTWDEFQAGQKKHLCSGAPQEISKETYNEMLNVLPPLAWCTKGNCEMFCMREMYTGTITNQYAYNLVDGKYYTKMVDVTDEETWIHRWFFNNK